MYLLATNNFVMTGGDGLGSLKQARDIKHSGLFIEDLFIKYLENNHIIHPIIDNRIIAIP